MVIFCNIVQSNVTLVGRVIINNLCKQGRLFALGVIRHSEYLFLHDTLFHMLFFKYCRKHTVNLLSVQFVMSSRLNIATKNDIIKVKDCTPEFVFSCLSDT